MCLIQEAEVKKKRRSWGEGSEWYFKGVLLAREIPFLLSRICFPIWPQISGPGQAPYKNMLHEQLDILCMMLQPFLLHEPEDVGYLQMVLGLWGETMSMWSVEEKKGVTLGVFQESDWTQAWNTFMIASIKIFFLLRHSDLQNYSCLIFSQCCNTNSFTMIHFSSPIPHFPSYAPACLYDRDFMFSNFYCSHCGLQYFYWEFYTFFIFTPSNTNFSRVAHFHLLLDSQLPTEDQSLNSQYLLLLSICYSCFFTSYLLRRTYMFFLIVCSL